MSLQLHQLATYLQGKAKNKHTVFYSEVVSHFGLQPLTGAWAAHELCGLFDQLDRQDADANRPFRTSMVISQEKNMPGQGYFTSLSAMKGIQSFNDAERVEVWIEQLKQAMQYQW